MSETNVGIKIGIDGAAKAESDLRLVAAGFDKVKNSAETIKDAVGGLPGVITALVGVASVGAFTGMIKGAIDSAAALNDLAIQSGASVESLSALAGIGKLSGQSAESIAGAMNKLARSMSGATEDSKGAGKALEAIGLSFDKFATLTPDRQMQAVAGAMDNFADGSGKAAVAMALFGKEGAQMLPFLKDLASVGELSAKVTTAQAAAADNFADNLTKITATSKAWTKEVAMGMVPALDVAAQAWLDVSNGAGGLREEARKLSADGSIKTWTEQGIDALTYLMDAFSGLKAVVKSLGETLGAVVAAGVETFSGIGAAVAKVLKGDFAGAYAEMNAANGRATTVWRSLGETLDSVWGEQTLGAKLRARMKDLRETTTVAEAAKQTLTFNNVTEKKAEKAKADPQVKAYADLVAAINEKIAANELELQVGGKLTEAEKARLDIAKLVEKGAISQADAESQQTQALLARLSAAEQAKLVDEARAKQLEALAKANTAAIAAAVKETAGLEDQATKQKQANEAIGLTTIQVAELEAARLDEHAAAKDRLATLKEKETPANVLLIDQYRAQADALRDLAKAKVTGARRTTEVDEARAAAAEWKKTADQIENNITDALMRGFESGKDFSRNLRDTVVNMFRTLVLRPIISAVVNPVAGAIASSLGLSGAANAATTGLNLASAGSSIASWLGLGASAGTGIAATAGTGLSLAASTGTGLGLTAGSTGLGLAGTAASGASLGTGLAAGSGAAAGGGLSAALGAIPGWGWALAGIALLANGLDDSGTMHSGGAAQWSAKGGTQLSNEIDPFGLGLAKTDFSQGGSDMAKSFAMGVGGMLDSVATAFGKKAGYSVAAAFADDTSRDKSWGGLLIKNAQGQDVVNWNDSRTSRWASREFSDGQAGTKEYAAAVAKDVRNYLVTQVPDWADAALNALGDSVTIEQLAATVTQINATEAALQGMGRASEAFANMGEKAAASLIDAIGGVEVASQKLSTYYTNFYTDSERYGLSMQQLSADFAELGVAMPDSRAGLRAMVDAAIAAGDTTLAANLIDLSDNFAALVPAAEDAAAAIAKTAQAMAKAYMDVLDTNAQRYLSKPEYADYTYTRASAKLADLGLNFSKETLAATDAASIKLYVQQLAALGGLPASTLSAIIDVTNELLNIKESEAEAATQAAQQATDDATRAAEAYSQALESAQSFITGISSSIKEFLASLDAQAEGIDSYTRAWAAFQTQMTLARAGDRDALGNITSSAGTLVETIRRESNSAAEANLRIGRVRGQLSSLPAQLSPEQFIVDGLAPAIAAAPLPVAAAVATAGAAQTAAVATSSAAQVAAINGLSAEYAAAIQPVVAKLTTGFDQLDTSVNGLLDFGEFSSAFSGLASDATLHAIFNELDINGDGQISRLEAIASNTRNLPTATFGFDANNPLFSVFEAIRLGTATSAFYLEDASNKLNAIQYYLGEPFRGTGSLKIRGETQAFAKGGVFSNSVVGSATPFDMGLMGEAGPEAIMPLRRGADGSLGVVAQVQMPDFSQYGRTTDNSAALVAEIRALREDNQAQARAMVQLQQRMLKITERWDGNGLPETRVVA